LSAEAETTEGTAIDGTAIDGAAIEGTATDTAAAGGAEARLAVRAQELDAANPLASCRDRFLMPDGTVYLDGNSLGALPAAVPDSVRDAVERQWGRGLIGSWFGDAAWWDAPLRIGDRVGTLIGAAPGQVAVGDSTSVQLFNTLTAAARLRAGRKVLLTDAAHFPTDAYLADSVAQLLGLEVRRLPVPELVEALAREGEHVALVSYPAVDYRTGERWDLAALTCATPRARCRSGWTEWGPTSRSAAPTSTFPGDRARLRSYTSRSGIRPRCSSRCPAGPAMPSLLRCRKPIRPIPESAEPASAPRR
jgi:hypothetical protein